MAVAALEVEELRCKLGGVDAVAGVSFSVPQGRTAGLIGPNGAGKSTLVGLIAGARLPDAGTVSLFGEDITRLPAWRRSRLGLARTFQLSGQFARLTVNRPGFHAVFSLAAAPVGEPGWCA
jgi:branched-chain amino acid transport system ATP-binding protein